MPRNKKTPSQSLTVFFLIGVSIIGALVLSKVIGETTLDGRSRAATQSTQAVMTISTAGDLINESALKQTNGSTVWMGNDNATTPYTGFSFSGANIPKGAVVTNATLIVTAAADQWIPVHVTITGERATTPTVFTTASPLANRTKTGAYLDSDTNVSWKKDTEYTYDVTAPVAEVVRDFGVLSRLSLIATGKGNAWARKSIQTVTTAKAPRLVITYQSAGTTPTATPNPSGVPTMKPTTNPTSIPNPTPTPVTSTGFVKRSGNALTLNGTPTRFVGANVYWLGLDEGGGKTSYPSHYRIEDVLSAASILGSNAVRSFGTISVGCPLCIEPTLNSFNQGAFDSLDYALFVARQKNLKMILTLSDNYQYYNGGKFVFTNWRGLPNEAFFTDATVINDFKKYITTVLTHVNPYTGLAYKDDPTIMAFETGNELYIGTTWTRDSFSAWTQTIAAHIKSIDPNHLIIDGRLGVDSASFKLADIDILSTHYKDPSQFSGEATSVASNGKAYMLGEYDWTGKRNGSADVTSYLSSVQASDVDLVFLWSLFGHEDTYGYKQHGDGYTLHLPGDTADMTARAKAIRTAYFKIRGLAVPPYPVPVAPQPNALGRGATGPTLTWKGSAGAATYIIERSTSGGAYSVRTTTVTDNTLPWTDSGLTKGVSYTYRIQAVNSEGAKSPYSPTVSILW